MTFKHIYSGESLKEMDNAFKEINNVEAIEQGVEKLCLLYQNNISNPTFEQKGILSENG